ncbi:MAG: hypothetical protein HOV81_30620 [Kofleriaceae bacterium]|nr:hypothetical protein [Kofleriaceae bacterium]
MVVAFTSACVDDPVEVETASEDPVSDDTVFHEVSISVGADGAVTVSEPRPITAKEQRAQNELKAAYARGETVPVAITRDSSCAYSSFWYYDRTDYSGNRICFTGVGTADFASYLRVSPFGTLVTWQTARGSFSAGSQVGTLHSPRTVRSAEVCGWNGVVFVNCRHLQPYCTPWGDLCSYPFSAYEVGSFDLTAAWEKILLQ